MQFQVQAQIHKMTRSSGTLKYLGPQNYTAPLTMYLHVCANSAQLKIPGFRYSAETKSTYGVNIYLKVQLTVTPKKVQNLTRDTKSHSKFEPNMICSFGAILVWKSDANADDDRKSDPYMSPSATLVTQ